MRRPKEIQYADLIIDAVRNDDRELPSAIGEITATEVQALKGDPAFRLQMIFQATLAHDAQVADALHRIDKAHVDAWTEFARRSYAKLGLEPREGIEFDQIGCALHAAGEGVMFRAMLSPRPDHTPPAPAELLNLIAKALVVATAKTGDGKTLEDVLNDLVKRNRSRRSEETAQDAELTIE
jgi:hypothetical protein